MEWKQQVLQLHYSNPTSEESPVEDSVEEEFIEPSVLEVLKDYKPERENAKKGRLESSRSRGKGSDATRRSRSGVMKRRDGAKFSGDREGGEGRMRRESRSSKDNRVVSSDRMSRDRASKDRAPRGDRFSRSESPARSNPKRENRPSTDHSSGRSRRNASRDASVNLASSTLFVRPFHCMLRSLFLAVAAIVHCNLRYAGTSELADEAWSHERSCFPIQHALHIYDQQPRRRRLRMVICRKGNVFTNMSKREGIV